MYYFWKNFNKLWGMYCGMQSAKTISGNFLALSLVLMIFNFPIIGKE